MWEDEGRLWNPMRPVIELQTNGLCSQAFLRLIFWETKLLPHPGRTFNEVYFESGINELAI